MSFAAFSGRKEGDTYINDRLNFIVQLVDQCPEFVGACIYANNDIPGPSLNDVNISTKSIRLLSLKRKPEINYVVQNGDSPFSTAFCLIKVLLFRLKDTDT